MYSLATDFFVTSGSRSWTKLKMKSKTRNLLQLLLWYYLYRKNFGKLRSITYFFLFTTRFEINFFLFHKITLGLIWPARIYYGLFFFFCKMNKKTRTEKYQPLISCKILPSYHVIRMNSKLIQKLIQISTHRKMNKKKSKEKDIQ